MENITSILVPYLLGLNLLAATDKWRPRALWARLFLIAANLVVGTLCIASLGWGWRLQAPIGALTAFVLMLGGVAFLVTALIMNERSRSTREPKTPGE